MPKVCDNTSVGQIIRDGEKIVVIERANYPEAFALPAGHVDGDPNFYDAMVREIKEEAGLEVGENKLVFEEDINNPCKREGGSFHDWEVFEASVWSGDLRAGDDAKRFFLAAPDELEGRTLEYAAMLAQRPRDVVAVYQEMFRALRRGDTAAARDLRARAKARESGSGR